MNQKINWYQWMVLMVKEFVTETAAKSRYEVVNIYECKKTGYTKAIVKLSERHIIERNISEIIIDDEFLEGLDKNTIRTLTYMATAENFKPDFSIIVQKMTNKVDNYLLEIRSKNSRTTVKKSPSEISKDKNLIARFKPEEANRIGYMAGVSETVMEYQMLYNKNK